MKAARYISLFLLILTLLFSCTGEVPNPIVGTYSLSSAAEGSHEASLALKSDGTFIFIQIVPQTSETIRIEGKYEYVLRAFNFTAADGSIYFTVAEGAVPSDRYSNIFLSEGTNSFLYGWKCDKNSGPETLILTTDPNNSSEIYTFSYAGGPTTLDSVGTSSESESGEDKQ